MNNRRTSTMRGAAIGFVSVCAAAMAAWAIPSTGLEGPAPAPSITDVKPVRALVHLTVLDPHGTVLAGVDELRVQTATRKDIVVMPLPDGTFLFQVDSGRMSLHVEHPEFGHQLIGVVVPPQKQVDLAVGVRNAQLGGVIQPVQTGVPPECGPGAGDCYTPGGNGTPGCDDEACCDAVCALDPFCCDTSWDGICATEATDNCGGAPVGACCFPDGTCNDGLNAAECDVNGGAYQGDGLICTDVICPVGACGPGAGDCFSPNGTPGCDDGACCAVVCALDPFCCDTEWDQICADEAAANCEMVAVGACCQPDGSCTVETEADCSALGGTYQGDDSPCTVMVGGSTYGASPGLAIPDNNAAGVSSMINVPDSFTIDDLDVELDISHTFTGDLCISLEHGGETVDLVQRPGADVPGDPCHFGSPFGCGADNYIGVILDDEGAGGPIESACDDDLTSPPNYVPNNPLSAFDGMDAQGAWTLTVSDNAAADTGTFDAWALHFNAVAESVCGGGACCFDDGSCSIENEDECGALGGTYQGDGVPCFTPDGEVATYTDSPGVPIPDDDPTGVTSMINVPDSFIIADLDVELNITHTWVGDLCVSVEHGGMTADIVQRPGFTDPGGPCMGCCGCGADNYAGVVLDDEGAGGSIEDACSPGLTSPPNYVPANPLSVFDGMDAQGAWTITVSDGAGADTGTLDAWALIFNAAGASVCDQQACGADHCEDAGEACPGPTYLVDTFAATSDYLDGGGTIDDVFFCGNYFGVYDVWCSYTPATDGMLFVHIEGPNNVGTEWVFGIYDGCPAGPWNLVACNVFIHHGVIACPVSAGHTYYIRSAARNFDRGEFVMDLVGPPCGPPAP